MLSSQSALGWERDVCQVKNSSFLPALGLSIACLRPATNRRLERAQGCRWAMWLSTPYTAAAAMHRVLKSTYALT